MLDHEQQVLHDVFAEVGVDLDLVPFRDHDSPYLCTDRWLVSIEANRFDTITALLAQPLDRRQELAFRVFLVPSMRGIIMPTFGVRLGTSSFFSAAQGEISDLAARAQRRVLFSPTSDHIAKILGVLIRASRAQALARLRRSDLGREEALRLAAGQIADGRDHLTSIPEGPLRDACAELIETVAMEAVTPQAGSLAGDVMSAVRTNAVNTGMTRIQALLAAAAEHDLGT